MGTAIHAFVEYSTLETDDCFSQQEYIRAFNQGEFFVRRDHELFGVLLHHGAINNALNIYVSAFFRNWGNGNARGSNTKIFTAVIVPKFVVQKRGKLCKNEQSPERVCI